MLCDECKKNEANVHMVTIINGEKQQKRLCSECAARQQSKDFSINDLISGFFDFYTPPSVNTKVCPKCGLSFAAFKKYGKLGCANCYNVFREELLPMFKGIQAGMQHTGRTPNAEHNRKAASLGELRQKLSEAIKSENYEEAAEIRDKIKEMEGE